MGGSHLLSGQHRAGRETCSSCSGGPVYCQAGLPQGKLCLSRAILGLSQSPAGSDQLLFPTGVNQLRADTEFAYSAALILPLALGKGMEDTGALRAVHSARLRLPRCHLFTRTSNLGGDIHFWEISGCSTQC